MASLRLLDRTASDEPLTMLGSSPSRDNYLYQMWIFYELAAFLERKNIAVEWESKNEIRFRWGAEPVDYKLTHDRELRDASFWEDIPAYGRAPGVRPDFYITRQGRQILRDDAGKIFWHEPGYMLDAKYYRPQSTAQAPSDPLKRMIADLQLTQERYGALLFGFLQSAEPDIATQATSEDSAREGDQAGPAAKQLDQPASGALYKVQPKATIQLRAANFAGPTLLFTGVLETLTRHTIYRVTPPLYGNNGNELMRTLGTLGNSRGYGGRSF